MMVIREYLDREGRNPFHEWRGRLDPEARRKVTTAVYRVGLGNFSHVEGVGAGVFECKVNFGPGYRVYFGKDGSRSWSCLAAERNNGSRTISAWRLSVGRTTSRGRSSRKKKGDENGSDARFQGDGASGCET